jgi:dTDP-4-amino-4,6-dideoxygalactose transaminase
MKGVELIPQCNPAALAEELRPQINAAIARVLDGGPYILGPEVEAFEAEWANWCGVEHAVGCANGTDALELILRSLDLPAGSHVLAPSHTAVATIAAIVRAGHRPMLADVDPRTYGLDPASVARCLEAARTEGDPVRALIAVHLYGHPVDLDALQALCTSYGIALLEDGSQAHGASWRGERIGSFGVAAGFSLYPTKNLGALGDAGVITCRSSEQAARLKRLRQYGWEQPAISEEPGVNSRLDPLQAAILRVKLPLLEAHNRHRQAIAAVYREHLAGELNVQLPAGVDERAEPVYHQFVVQLPALKRDAVRARLAELGVGTLLHYPQAAHQMPAYRGQSWVGVDPQGLRATEALIPRILSLPMGPHLTIDQTVRVAELLLQALREMR